MQKIFWIFMGFIVCVIGGVFLWYGGKDLALAWGSKSWPSITGKVTESTVKHSTSTQRRRSHSGYHRTRTVHRYTPLVKYTYTVNGTEYSGDTIAFGMGASSDEKGARSVAGKYPSGSEVKVCYDPGNPGTSVLQAGNIVPGLLVLLGGIVIFALGIIVPFFIPDKPRTPPVEKSAAQASTGGGEVEGFKF